MVKRRSQFSLVGGHDRTDTINALRELADALENDPTIRGAVVVVSRDGRKSQIESCGRLARSSSHRLLELTKAALQVLLDD